MLPVISTQTYFMNLPRDGASVEYRPYLIKEEKILLQAMESGAEDQIIHAIKSVISNCTFGKINVDDLAMYELEFIFTKLRGVSVGETSEVGIKCNECESTNRIRVDFNKLEVVGDVKGTVIKVNDNVSMRLEFPSMSTILGINKRVPESDQVGRVYAVLEACITAVYNGDEVLDVRDHTPEDVHNFLESLPTAIFNDMRMFVENMPYAKIDTKFQCKECGSINEIELRGIQAFFG